VLVLGSCGRREDPQAKFDRDYQIFLRGDLKLSEAEAEQAYRRFLGSRPEWAWRFRILEAEASLWRGLYEQVPELLRSPPAFRNQQDLAISASTLVAVANVHLRKFPEAERNLRNAEQLCGDDTGPRCGEVIQARGLLASQQGQFVPAAGFFEESLSFARGHADHFLESTSLLNLGAMALAQGHFDEAIDRSEAAYKAAHRIDAKIVELVVKGNLGWAYYKLGDSEKALQLSAETERLASQLGDVSDQENELTNIGYIYMDSGRFDLAAQSFQQALRLADGIQAKEDIYNALRVLARLSLETGDLTNASQYAQRALESARESGNHVDELYPVLVQGQVAARRGDPTEAENKFHAVETDETCPVFLKWEAQHSLARSYEDESHADAADREYRAALATFEAARYDVRHEDSQLSFLTNASRIYDDYIHFLVARGKADDALRWADYSRARTLAEGLGLAPKGASYGPPPLKPQQIARQAEGTILFYWLGEKQSYLWAITPQKTVLFTIPPAPDIDAAVQRYRRALVGPQDILETASADGTALYRMLISPAQALLTKDAQVFIIPDGSLNSLNFETLLVPEPKLHYWIEDATIADASSLRLLAASHNSSHDSKAGAGKLLLIGDAVAPNPDYGDLPKAGVEIENVEKHFAPAGREVLTRAQATALAYLGSAPEQFTYIHFVAHGTASRLSPLDSAVILSKASAEEDSFKLYARDIIKRPLRADLVTISTCYGAGARAYTGEGLVGLSWAFLRAGAHNVIGALWEVSDASTPRLMDQLYDELKKGRSPEAALRSAKLSLLHSDTFRKPFYWAPFQLYTGT
jgi:CHAT domain-containing protein/Tfp pilus assembly protein PilF